MSTKSPLKLFDELVLSETAYQVERRKLEKSAKRYAGVLKEIVDFMSQLPPPKGEGL